MKYFSNKYLDTLADTEYLNYKILKVRAVAADDTVVKPTKDNSTIVALLKCKDCWGTFYAKYDSIKRGANLRCPICNNSLNKYNCMNLYQNTTSGSLRPTGFVWVKDEFGRQIPAFNTKCCLCGKEEIYPAVDMENGVCKCDCPEAAIYKPEVRDQYLGTVICDYKVTDVEIPTTPGQKFYTLVCRQCGEQIRVSSAVIWRYNSYCPCHTDIIEKQQAQMRAIKQASQRVRYRYEDNVGKSINGFKVLGFQPATVKSMARYDIECETCHSKENVIAYQFLQRSRHCRVCETSRLKGKEFGDFVVKDTKLTDEGVFLKMKCRFCGEELELKYNYTHTRKHCTCKGPRSGPKPKNIKVF